MSAFSWLEFIAALILAAVLWALLQGVTTDIFDQSRTLADTSAANTGLDWLNIWITWLPLWVVLLAMFGFIVAVVVRRRRVHA